MATTKTAPPDYAVLAYKGYFIGCFAAANGKGQYFGWAHICVERPEKRTTAKALETIRSVGAYDDAARSSQAAEFQAKQIVDGLGQNWAPFTAPGWISSR